MKITVPDITYSMQIQLQLKQTKICFTDLGSDVETPSTCPSQWVPFTVCLVLEQPQVERISQEGNLWYQRENDRRLNTLTSASCCQSKSLCLYIIPPVRLQPSAPAVLEPIDCHVYSEKQLRKQTAFMKGHIEVDKATKQWILIAGKPRSKPCLRIKKTQHSFRPNAVYPSKI